MNATQIEDIYELSPMQQGLLFHTIAAPHSGVYFEQYGVKLQGHLNVRAFQQAWQTVTDRHPILRTAFYWEELEQPYQVMYRQVEVAIAFQDWRELSTPERERQLETFLKADRERGFELSQAPLFRLTLLQISDDAYYLVHSHHHIILEGWSCSLLWGEIRTLYLGFCQGKTLTLAPSRPYRDYIVWLQQQDLSKAELFWRQQLRGFRAPTPLAVDRLSNNSLPSQAEDCAKEKIDLSVATTATLQSFAQQHQLTLNVLLQGTLALLLSRYSGQTDIVFGIATSGRPPELAGVESIVGLFLNTLPLRVQVVPDAFLIPWLKQLQAQQADISEYEYAPLLQIQGWSEVPRGLPLFESVLVFNNFPVDAGQSQLGDGIEFSDYRVFSKTNYPLTLMVIPGQQLRLEIIWDTRRFEQNAISRLLGHLKTLLEGIVASPEQQLRDLPLLTGLEWQQLVVEWNQTQQDYPQQCVHQLFEMQVERTPNAVAMEFAGETLTYGELNQKANQLAHYLRQVGVSKEKLVGFCVERSPLMLVGLLAVFKAGGAYLPLDPAYPQERLTFILNDARVSLLLTESAFLKNNDNLDIPAVCLDIDAGAIAQHSTENLHLPLTLEDLAYVIYTSGSTGKPKGVLIPHQGLTNCLTAYCQTLKLSGGDTFLALATLSFDIAALELYLPLILGDRLILASREIATDGRQLLELLQASPITIMQATPVTWQMLLAAGWEGKKHLKILCGGEAMSPELAKRLLPRCEKLWNIYGPTETTLWAALRKIESTTGVIPIGRPIANTQFYILDQQLQPVPIGIPGELHIGGAGLGWCYLNRPELTAERFISNPFNQSYGEGQRSKISERLYKTGDLVRYLSEGTIEFIGRIDYQIKLRGFRIELGEIEAVLNQQPAVKEAVVMAREDSPGDKQLVAYVVQNPTNKGSEELAKSWQTEQISQFRSFLGERLPRYMIPSAFVMLEALPLTPNRKVDRRSLPAPEMARSQTTTYIAPRTAIETELARIWTQILGVEIISIDDNFFDLGGHSLMATRIISQIRSTFQLELPLLSIFEAPTISWLAKRIEMATETELGLASPPIKHGRREGDLPLETATKAELGLALPPIKRGRREGDLPLSLAQTRLWFLDQLDPGNPSHSLFTTLRLTGAFNLKVFEQSLNEIVRRHEILRTNFIQVNDEPVQVISPTLTLTIPVIHIQDSLDRDEQIQQFTIAEANRPFNLSKEPLLRLFFLQINPTEGILLLTIHHIISDGWSMGLLLKEITVLYKAFNSKQPSPLPELSIQYCDFAIWQRQWLQGQVLQTQLDYWQQQLGNNLPTLRLPTDRPRASVQTFRGAKQMVVLSPQLSQKLKNLSKSIKGTLFMTLLAAFQTLLHYLSGQDEIVVGTDIANRKPSETEELIGFFVNQLVLRINVGEHQSFRELLERVRQTALEAYAHQDLPFDKLVEVLNPERNLSQTPLFQVKFVLQNAPMPTLEFGGLTLEALTIDRGTARFDLLLNMTDMETGLIGLLEYNTDLFNGTTIARFLGLFETLLNYIVTEPDIKLSDIAKTLAKEDEQQRNVKAEVYQQTARQKLMRVKRKSAIES